MTTIMTDEDLFQKNLKYLSLIELYSIKDDIEQKIKEIITLVPKINCVTQQKLIGKIIVINKEIAAKEIVDKMLKF